MEKVSSDEKKSTIPPVTNKADTPVSEKENQDIEQPVNEKNSDAAGKEDLPDVQALDLGKVSISVKEVFLKSPSNMIEVDIHEAWNYAQEKDKNIEEEKLDDIDVAEGEEKTVDAQEKSQFELPSAVNSEDIRENSGQTEGEKISNYLEEGKFPDQSGISNKSPGEILFEEEEEPVFDGTEVPGMEGNRSLSSRSSDNDFETQGSAWPDKAVALSHYVKQKSLGAMSTVFRRLSGKSEDGLDVAGRDNEPGNDNLSKGDKDLLPESVGQKVSKSAERSGWNPLSLIRTHDAGRENKSEREDSVEDLARPISMKGRVILYTRLGCQECAEARRYLQRKGLKYVEINIDVYLSRKLELEKIAGSSVVPRVFFNEILIGGLSELKRLEDSGKLEEKIEYVVTEEPSYEAPLPPLSGEDDLSSGGAIDELALIVRKMKGLISINDRFYKMRRYTDCFLGKEAVDFLSEDQYLEREEVSHLVLTFR